MFVLSNENPERIKKYLIDYSAYVTIINRLFNHFNRKYLKNYQKDIKRMNK